MHSSEAPQLQRQHCSCHTLLALSCMPLLPSLAVFLCPSCMGQTGLRLQSQRKSTVIQLGTAMPSKPCFLPWLPQEPHCPGMPCLSGGSTPPRPSEKIKVIFPHFRE